MLFDLTSNIRKYLTSSDMNYLALLSACAPYAPGFFCVYNLSDWFQRRTVSQVKSRMGLKSEPLPPIWMSTLVRNRLPAEMDQPSLVFSAPIQSFPALSFSLIIHAPNFFFQPPENCIFWAPAGICFTSDMNANLIVLMCFLKKKLKFTPFLSNCLVG